MPRRPDRPDDARIGSLGRRARQAGALTLSLALTLQLGQAGFRVSGRRTVASRVRSVRAASRRRRPVHIPARLPSRLRAHPERLALLPSFDRAAAATGVPAALLEAVAWQESGWQNKVVSAKGAQGVGQLKPDTVAFTSALLHRSLNPARPNDNVLLMARYLAYLLGRTGGDQAAALAAYAQGSASIQREGLHPGTRQYVANVLALRDLFAS